MAKAENKLKKALNNSGKSVTAAVVKATEARDKAKNALTKAESAAEQAEQKVKDVTERADESIKIQSAIIQSWVQQAFGALAKSGSHTTPDSVQSCRIIYPGGTKSGNRCTCFSYGYVVLIGVSGSDPRY